MKTNIAKAICKTLGAGHLVAQTTADVLLTLEANTAFKMLGNDKKQTMEHRVNKTDAYQDKMMAYYKSKMSKNLKNK